MDFNQNNGQQPQRVVDRLADKLPRQVIITRKGLIIGIVAVIVILILLITLLGGKKEAATPEEVQNQEIVIDNSETTLDEFSSELEAQDNDNTSVSATELTQPKAANSVDLPSDKASALAQEVARERAEAAALAAAAKQNVKRNDVVQKNTPPAQTFPTGNIKPVEVSKAPSAQTYPAGNVKATNVAPRVNAFAAVPDSHFTLQLSSGSTEANLDAYAKRMQLNQYWIYETERNGKAWFVLVQGDYPTLEDAQVGVSRLPEDAQAKKPWIKPVRLVKQEAK